MSKTMRLLANAAMIITCCFSCVAGEDELPPGVPNPIGPDGRYTRALTFTTKSYQAEVLNRLIVEVNEVALQLHLPEGLPITRSNIVSSFISPFGYGYAKKSTGNNNDHELCVFLFARQQVFIPGKPASGRTLPKV